MSSIAMTAAHMTTTVMPIFDPVTVEPFMAFSFLGRASTRQACRAASVKDEGGAIARERDPERADPDAQALRNA
jgi:hypothetical protein